MQCNSMEGLYAELIGDDLYIYMLIYIYGYTCISTYMHIYAYISIYMYLYIYMSIYIFMHEYIYVCMYIYICHRHEEGFGKEMTRFGISVIFGIFGMDAGGCADKLWWFFLDMHSGFPTKIIEQTIVMSLYDVTRFSHVTEGGKYKRRV